MLVPPFHILRYALPLYVLFIFVENYFLFKEHKKELFSKDTRNNLAIFALSIGVSGFTKILVLGVYFFVYEHRIYTFQYDVWVWLIALILYDFCKYCMHRFSHTIRWFWAAHVVHHSSEEFRLSTNFRTSIFVTLTGSFLFDAWLPILGFHPLIIISLGSLSSIYSFFCHTELVGKLGKVVEYIFVTPSHHRAHHGSQPIYIDKNYGSIFIIWDRMFGTFEEESEPPVYGLTTPIASQNLVVILLHEWKAILKDVAKSRSINDLINAFWKVEITPPTHKQ
ncbi:sterol desaturase family protein [Telluribacter humicola]|uniref:sterol desaturase family protein n=1 Tax=Telluribacter humicola TaxID=1720261 RepID=UPI001A96C5EE|nr:sterol desaturase family protein [Telluribacter humicola]